MEQNKRKIKELVYTCLSLDNLQLGFNKWGRGWWGRGLQWECLPARTGMCTAYMPHKHE